MPIESLKSLFDTGTVVLLFLTFAFGAGALITGKILDKQKDEKFEQLKLDVATANQRAAEANKSAEDERLARVKIEQQLAPRTLNLEDRKTIAKDIKRFSSDFSGRKVTISSPVGDAEGIVFSLGIMDIITGAGIGVDPVIGRIEQVGLVKLGVEITGPAADQEFMKVPASDIRAHCDTSLHVEWGPKYSGVAVAVWTKPVAGLPNVYPAVQ